MATRDIQVGDCNGGSDGGGDITVCHERTNDEGREINVCKPDCENPTGLFLSGDTDITGSSQYTATGGVQPYTWSISCGSISNTGSVLSLSGCCGSGTVTVIDACGQSASKVIRFSSGQWVVVGWTSGEIINSESSGCPDYPCLGIGQGNLTCEDTNGSYAREYTLQCYLFDDPNNGPCYEYSDYSCVEILEWQCL